MTRKTIMLSAIAVLALVVVGVAVAGTTLAQRGGQFADVHVAKEGDPEVVVTVQGRDVARGEIRKAADYWMAADDSLTKDAATQKIIVGIIDRHVAQAEIERRGLVPTREEAREYMQPHMEHCLADTPQGDECRKHIEKLGFDPHDDGHWENVGVPEYGKSLGDVRLHQTIFEEMALTDADSDARVTALDQIKVGLRDGAEIIWHDEELARQYQSALARE